MKNFITLVVIAFLFAAQGCNNHKPKPISKDFNKTTVVVNGKKDSVINNNKENYGTATVSEPCVKCLLGVVQTTAGYKAVTASKTSKNIIYSVNWITSKDPVNIDSGKKIINGMQLSVRYKDGNTLKKLITYLYNNESARFYATDSGNSISDVSIPDSVLKKIRNSCFWGVASSK